MNKESKPVIIRKEKLTPVGNGKRLTKEEIVKSAKNAEKKVLQENKSRNTTQFIEME